MSDDIFSTNDQHKRLSMKVKKDVFYEMSVFSTTGTNILSGVFMALCFLMGALAFVILLFSGLQYWMMYVFAALCGFLCYLFYWLSGRTKVEYDYTFTNGTIDIARIYNDKKRQKLLSIESSELLSAGKITSEKFKSIFEDSDVRKVNYFLNKGTHLYFISFVKDSKKIAVIFEPDEEFIGYVSMFNPDLIID